MARKRCLLIPLVGLAFLAGPAEGQLTLAWSGVFTEALGGQWGGDVRLGVEPPLSPVGVFGGADYFFTECPETCGLWGWRVGGIVKSTNPVLQPYLTGALLVRELETGDTVGKREGLSLGIGLRLSFGLMVQGEITREFLGEPLDHWVFRVGIGF
jgi:hypothetical protein